MNNKNNKKNNEVYKAEKIVKASQSRSYFSMAQN